MSKDALLIGGLILGGGAAYLLSQQSKPIPVANIENTFAFKIYQALLVKFAEVEPQLENRSKTLYETENALAAELVRKAEEFRAQDSDYIEKQDFTEQIIGTYTQYGIKVSPDDATLYMHVRQIPLNQSGLTDPNSDHGHVGVRFRLVSNSRNYDQILFKSTYWGYIPTTPFPAPPTNVENTKAWITAKFVDEILLQLNANAETSPPSIGQAINQWTTATANNGGTFVVSDATLSVALTASSMFPDSPWRAVLFVNNYFTQDKKLKYEILVYNTLSNLSDNIIWDRGYSSGLANNTQAYHLGQYFKGLYEQRLAFNATTAKQYLIQYANEYNEGSYTQIPITTLFGYSWQMAFSDSTVGRITALSLPPGIQVELKYPYNTNGGDNTEFYTFFQSEYFSYDIQTMALGSEGMVEYIQKIYNDYRNLFLFGAMEGIVKGILPFTNSTGLYLSSYRGLPTWYIDFEVGAYGIHTGLAIQMQEYGGDNKLAIRLFRTGGDIPDSDSFWRTPNWRYN